MANIEKIEWVQLDTQKFNVVVIRLPEHSTEVDHQAALAVAEQLRETGARQIIIVPPGWDVQFAEQEPAQKPEGE